MKTVLLSLLLLAAASLSAADVSGKWSGTVDVKDNGEARTVNAVVMLKQDGNTLTGTAGGDENEQHPIRKGTIEGDKVTFEVDGGDVVFYVDLKVAGDQMTGEARRGDSERMKITLKRAEQPHASTPGYQALVKDAKTRIQEMDIEQLKKLQSSGEKFTLIDVREDNEWTAGHAAGAVHLGKGVIERDIESKVAQKGAKLVLYCGGGSRSALAADALMKMGYSNVFSLAGGMGAYKSAGLPIDKSEK